MADGFGIAANAISGALQGFAEQFAQQKERERQEGLTVLRNVMQDPELARVPAIRQSLKKFGFDDESFEQLEALTSGTSLLEQFLGPAEAAAPQAPPPAAPGVQPVTAGAPTMAPVQPARAPTVPPPVTEKLPPQPRRRPRNEAEVIREKLPSGSTYSYTKNGQTFRITGLTPAERGAVAFDRILGEMYEQNPDMKATAAIMEAGKRAIREVGFTKLPPKIREAFTTGNITAIQEEIKAAYARLQARERVLGGREAAVALPTTEQERITAETEASVQATLDRLREIGVQLTPEQEAQWRTNTAADISNRLLREQERTRMGAGLPEAAPEAGVRSMAEPALKALTDSQVGIAGLENIVDLIDEQIEMFGPFEGRMRNMLEAFGLESVEYTRTKEAIVMAGQDIRRVLTGAQASAQEIEQILGRMPKSTDPPNVIKAKLIERTREAVTRLQIFLQERRAQGFRVPDVEIPENLQRLLAEASEAGPPPLSLAEARERIKRAK